MDVCGPCSYRLACTIPIGSQFMVIPRSRETVPCEANFKARTVELGSLSGPPLCRTELTVNSAGEMAVLRSATWLYPCGDAV